MIYLIIMKIYLSKVEKLCEVGIHANLPSFDLKPHW